MIAQALFTDHSRQGRWRTIWPDPGITHDTLVDASLVAQLDSWLPSDAVREALFAANAAKL